MLRYIYLLLLFTISTASAQVVRFKGTYGGLAMENGYSAIQTHDNGYVAVGSTSSYSSNMDVYLFKTDSVGKMQWFKNIGTPNVDIGRSVIQTVDTCYVVAGYSNDAASGYDVYIIKTNRWGDTLWTKKYGGLGWDFAYSVVETHDSGLVVAGGTYSFGVGDEDFYLLRLNKNGDTLWTKTYGGSSEDEASCVIESSEDSGLVMVGKTKSYADIIGSAYVVKTDRHGNVLYTKEYGGAANDYLKSIVETKVFKGYIAVGATSSYGTDENVYMMRMKYNCDTVWTKSEKPTTLPSGRDVANGIAISAYDSCFAFLGFTESGSPGYEDAYFFKFDSTGLYKSATTYGTVLHDIGNSIAPTKDKGFIVCGQTDTTATGFGQPNVLLVKVDSLGFTKVAPFVNSVNKSVLPFSVKLNVYPNPAYDYATVIIQSVELINDYRLSIYDISGRCLVCENNVTSSAYIINKTIDTSSLCSGIYIIEVRISDTIAGYLKFLKK